MGILIMLLFLFSLSAGLIFRRLINVKSNRGTGGGITMTDPGRPENNRPDAALANIENIEPWVFTHHLYNTMEFTSTEEAFKWAVSRARKGRAESWVVTVPRAVCWTGALRKTATLAEFKDYFLDIYPRRPQGAELTDAHS